MGNIEKIYRTRRRVLVGAFIFSAIFFILSMMPTIVSFFFPDIMKIRYHWINYILNFGKLIVLLLILGLIARYLHLRIYFKKKPSFIQTVEDERIRISWLKAYRFAFYLIIGVHCANVFGLFEFGLKHTSPLREWISLAVCLPALFGAALYFSREGGHE
jgi:fumarate reductase subunit C